VHHKGLTLFEMLIVLGIIGILMSVLTWGFGQFQRQGRLSQAAAHGSQVSMGINAFLTRNIDLNLDDWTRTLPAGSTSGGPASVAGLSGFDCRPAATLTRTGMAAGSDSWGEAPAPVGCVFERVGRRFLVHTWGHGLDQHFINGRSQ
jgi:prepilin-type N-terminal cleavage/methylation domain-containing protein